MLVFVGGRKDSVGRTDECSGGADCKRVLTPGACARVSLQFPGGGVGVGSGLTGFLKGYSTTHCADAVRHRCR